jgi:SAM-dependent methyltransferase
MGTVASTVQTRLGMTEMGMKIQDLNDVVPWGRPFDEYVNMFGLSASDLDGRILDCGGGPASFAAEATDRGHRVVACDPIYRFTAVEIARRIDETYPVLVAGMEAERERFVWTEAGSPRQHAEGRMAAMRRFLDDFPEGLRAGRYVAAALPQLGFAGGSFDLALSSHFLFLYSAHLSLEFHLAAIAEMLRVAGQARIFPLLDLSGEPSRHVQPVIAELGRGGHAPRIVTVPYEFQRGGNQVLVVERGSGPGVGSR